MDFVVIDTEGKPELSELAIVDSQGRVIYEGFSKNRHNNIGSALKVFINNQEWYHWLFTMFGFTKPPAQTVVK